MFKCQNFIILRLALERKCLRNRAHDFQLLLSKLLSPTDSEGDVGAARACGASRREARLLLLVEMLNNEEEDCRAAQGGAARQIRGTSARRIPNRPEARGSNDQRTAQRN